MGMLVEVAYTPSARDGHAGHQARLHRSDLGSNRPLLHTQWPHTVPLCLSTHFMCIMYRFPSRMTTIGR